jgi:hypothetical protein
MIPLIKKKPFIIGLLMLCSMIAHGQTENLSSRFYFPGLIGMGVPAGDEQTSMKTGFALNTACEYRPVYVNSYFFRFNYDNISNKYYNLDSPIPTNVKRGKLSSNFFLLGVGYRRKFQRLGAYLLLQPGYNISNYTVVNYNTNSSIAIGNASTNHFSGKLCGGIEYYIVPHFALVFEPAYYHLFPGNNSYVMNPNYISYNIGFTTTLF